MLLEDSNGPYMYIPSDTPQPRAAVLCRMLERCTESALPFPTYLLEVCEGSDVMLGLRFAITVPYALEGLSAPESFIPVHTYRDLSEVLSENTPGEKVAERGNIVAV